MEPNDIKTLSDIGQSWLTCLAIVVGGIWAYRRFMRQREACPTVNFEQVVSSRRLSESRTLLRIGLKAHNVGRVLVKLTEGEQRIQKVLPYDQKTLDFLAEGLESGKQEADWVLLATKTLSDLQWELEPGESEVKYFDFFVDGDIESVLVYSYVVNTAKRRIGWNDTTLHDIASKQGESVMGKKRQGYPKPRPAAPPAQTPKPVSPSHPAPRPQGPPKSPPEPPPPAPKS